MISGPHEGFLLSHLSTMHLQTRTHGSGLRLKDREGWRDVVIWTSSVSLISCLKGFSECTRHTTANLLGKPDFWQRKERCHVTFSSIGETQALCTDLKNISFCRIRKDIRLDLRRLCIGKLAPWHFKITLNFLLQSGIVLERWFWF